MLNMKKLILYAAILGTFFLLAGCEVEIGDSNSDEPGDSALEFLMESGIQTDIFQQKTEVVQDDDSYYKLLSSIPSMSGVELEFNSDTDTLVSIISNVVGCSYYPVVQGVSNTQGTIIIDVVNKREKSPETCNPTGESAFSYKLIKFEKTYKPISIIIKNEA